MCGIAGILSRQPREEITAHLKLMSEQIARRGPDGQGLFSQAYQAWNMAFAHRRLSIIDLEGGAQPMSVRNQNWTITYNGELFNFHELKSKLIDKNIEFQSHSDTEVLLQAIAEMGEKEIPSLNGMYAFATWNQATGTCYLVRDRCGIKPLYYSQLPDGGLIFASTLSAILAHPAIKKEIDPQGLFDFLMLDYVPAPRSAILKVNKLPPGCYLTWKEGRVSDPISYWSIPKSPRDSSLVNETELIEHGRELIHHAVRSQLVSDVPVGTFLSGGLDSSYVTALACRYSKAPVQTFSIGFREGSFDESPFANQVSKLFQTVHHEYQLKESEAVERLFEVFGCLDEPLGDHSIVPTYFLSELAAQHVKVVLGGDGGDEVWGGYPTYQAHRLAQYFKQAPRFLTQPHVLQMLKLFPISDAYQSIGWKIQRFLNRWERSDLRRHLRWMAATDIEILRDLMPANLAKNSFYSHLPDNELEDIADQSMRLDFQTYMVGSVLCKVDRASMHHGLEVRPPLLDGEFVDWAFTIPAKQKLKAGVSKYLLKKMALEVLPPEIVYRKKHGFSVPVARWMHYQLKPLVQQILKDSPIWDLHLLDAEKVRLMWRDQEEQRSDHSKFFWSLLVLHQWIARHF